MNCSDIIDCVYEYLSFRNVSKSAEINTLIESCYDEIDKLDCFRYTYLKQDSTHEFINKEPYLSFLSGAYGYYLVEFA